MSFPTLHRFRRYFAIGLLNTALHWCLFFAAHYWLELNQAFSNLIAFLAAVTFSFFMNAHYTFRSEATALRYLLFMIFMATLSFCTGYAADKIRIAPLITVAIFSGISLVAGFLYANYIVFRRHN